METDVCACGHVRGSHLIRWGMADTVRAEVAAGHSACNDCVCAWFVSVLTIDVSERERFRNRPKMKRGNFGTGHPLNVGLAKADPEKIEWERLECGTCSRTVAPENALVLDSSVYCGPCFIQRPEVHLAYPKAQTAVQP